MSDLLGISSSAVAAYQRALGTVSNNIANVGTEGYSRQTSNLAETAPIKQASMYLGSGVIFDSVKRSFDVFAESNLRNSNTDLATQTPMLNYAQRVMDIMGDKSIGLSSALDTFFDAARSLSVDPASTIMRTSFLKSTEGVGSRFAELSGQLGLVADETHQALQTAADQVNTLTEQLALVNQQLVRSPTLDGQPSELMDKRDLLLRQLSEFSRIKTSFTSNGIVSVSLSSTMKQSVVVDGIKSRPIGLDPKSGSKFDMVVDPYGNTEPLSGASGGTIGGLHAFISQVLEPAQKGLDIMAENFVKEVNGVQTAGIDGYGHMGSEMLRINSTASSSAAGIQMLLKDPLRVSTGGIFRVTGSPNNPSDVRATVSYVPDATNLTALSNPNLVNNPYTNKPLNVDVAGARVFTPVTQIAAGIDSPVIYLDKMQPGQQLQVLTRDGRQLIGTSLTEDQKYQMLTPENGFTKALTYSDQYLNLSGEKGYRGLDVFYGAKAGVVNEQQFDALGQVDKSTPVAAQLNSQRVTPLQVTTDTRIIAKGAITLNGMALGALTLKAGETLGPQQVAAWLNAGIDQNPSFTSDKAKLINPISGSDLSIELADASAFPDEGGVIQIGGEKIYYSGKAENSLGEKNILTGLIRGLSFDTQGNKVSDPNLAVSHPVTEPVMANDMLHAKVFNEIRVAGQALDFRKELSINGVTIGSIPPGSNLPAQYHDLTSLVQAIQAKSPQSGVSARIADNGDLVLENLPGKQGETIQIGPQNTAGAVVNALGLNLSPGADKFYGMVQLNRRLADPSQSDIRLSFGEYGPVDARQTGSPFELGLLGFRTGAYIEGKVPDGLQVFVTGQGKAQIAASFSGQPADPKEGLRVQTLQIKFTAPDRYVILDAKTGTELANRHYDNTVLDPQIEYQGVNVKFTSAPEVGDVYSVDGNFDGLGSNQNMLAMADLASKKIMSGKTFSEGYIDQVNDVGNAAQQAKITQQALTVVNDQAKSARDKVSGVNLDDEAADLIRFQQAYQAAAKTLQVSGQLFDAIVQIR